FQRVARLLELESEAEAEQARQQSQRLSPAEAEAAGNSLVSLVVRDEHPGLGGRFILTLGKRDASRPLPWTRLQVGSPVLLSLEGVAAAAGQRGVVCERDAQRVCVAVNEPPEDTGESPTYRLALPPAQTPPQPPRP